MKKICLALALVGLCSVSFAGIIDEFEIIRRGDANHSGSVDMSDAVFLNSYIGYGGNAPPCMNEADVNHDGKINSTDVSYLLNFLYNGGAPPPFPGPNNSTCIQGPLPILGCAVLDC